MDADFNMSEQRFRFAEELEEKGRYEEALSYWRELASGSEDAGIFCRQARAANCLGYAEESEKAFREAIRLDRDLSVAYLGLASVLIDQKRYDDAVNLLTRSVIREDDAIAHNMLGVAFSSLGKREEAIGQFEAALVHDPTFEEADYNLASMKLKDDPAEAERLFLRAIELEPDYADAHRELGCLLHKTGQDPQAEYHLRRAIELVPTDAWAHVYLGNLLWKRSDVNAAVPQFEKAAQVCPEHAFPLWSLANVYEDQGLWEKAASIYEQALKVDPGDSIAHMNFGRMLHKWGKDDLASVHLRNALALDPDCSAARKLLASLQQV